MTMHYLAATTVGREPETHPASTCTVPETRRLPRVLNWHFV